MRSRSSLVPFETLIDYLCFHGLMDKLDSIIRIKKPLPREASVCEKISDLPEEWREKFMNTWWEVCLPVRQTNPPQSPQCSYLADSLRDALRLRPDIDITFWSNSSESFAEYLKCTEEWMEDAEELELVE